MKSLLLLIIFLSSLNAANAQSTEKKVASEIDNNYQKKSISLSTGQTLLFSKYSGKTIQFSYRNEENKWGYDATGLVFFSYDVDQIASSINIFYKFNNQTINAFFGLGPGISKSTFSFLFIPKEKHYSLDTSAFFQFVYRLKNKYLTGIGFFIRATHPTYIFRSKGKSSDYKPTMPSYTLSLILKI